MNHELLEKALRRWEEQTGHVIDVTDSSGNLSMSQYGFSKSGS